MINNIENLFSKYKLNLNSKKEIESKIFLFIKEKLDIELPLKNIKVDLKNKRVRFINLNSSLRFILNNKFNDELLENFKKEISFDLLLI